MDKLLSPWLDRRRSMIQAIDFTGNRSNRRMTQEANCQTFSAYIT